jgi:heparosan-N-sulfate-glucuronate 5-epimerase
MRSIHDLWYLGREFARYLAGTDYFRQRQGLGHYFQDDRCYYNDLTKKADWTGPRRGNLPALHLAGLGEDVVWPSTVLLYGLGSIDKFLAGAGDRYLEQARAVCRWMPDNLLPQGYFDNRWTSLYPELEFYSNNSAMCQGLAMSFAVRAIRCKLADQEACRRLDELLDSVKTNMLAPLDQEGTSLRTAEGLFLLEFCRKDHNVVLNGWIFAVFGLIDYLKHRQDPQTSAFLKETLSTMIAVLPRYTLPSGWSLYDNAARISSPFYHDLHIALLDAVYRLTQENAFRDHLQLFRRGNNAFNRCRYTLLKMRDKLTDSRI